MKFTQFLRPSGRRQTTEIYRSPEVEAKAREVEAAGGRFEVEVLMEGVVSLEVVMDHEGEVVSVAGELVKNGPGVPDAVDLLVTIAHGRIFDGKHELVLVRDLLVPPEDEDPVTQELLEDELKRLSG